MSRARPVLARELPKSWARLGALRDLRRGMHVEAVLDLAASAFYLRGWAADDLADDRSVTVVANDDRRTVLTRPVRYPRARLDRLFTLMGGGRSEGDNGFVAYLELDASSRLSNGSRLELRRSGREPNATRLPAPRPDLQDSRSMIARDLVRFRHRADGLAMHVFPAMRRVQRSLHERTRIERLAELGPRPKSAEISVVVALDRGSASLEHQLAQFVHDPDVAGADLVYVCDYREFDAGLLDLAEDLFSLYRLPFRLAGVNWSASFQAMTDIAVGLAAGELLVLLDPDVLPSRPGWLTAMKGFYEGTPGLGALGPKLLYEDDSVRSAGASFSSGQLVHHFQGSHRSLPATDEPRPVPAVSAACLMASKDRYTGSGRLRGLHLDRAYEGADLCLRLAGMGWESWNLPGVELYHLDEASRQETPRMTIAMGRYDAWAHGLALAERSEGIELEAQGSNGAF